MEIRDLRKKKSISPIFKNYFLLRVVIYLIRGEIEENIKVYARTAYKRYID